MEWLDLILIKSINIRLIFNIENEMTEELSPIIELF